MQRASLASLLAASALAAAPARSAVQFFTDEATWAAASASLGLAVEPFDTTAANVALADQVGGPPANNQNLGPVLDFPAASTGLSVSFELEARQGGAGIVFQDTEGGGPVFGSRSLSLGDVDNHEDDDLEIRFPSGTVRAVGIFVVGNDLAADEGMSATDTSASLHTGPFVGTTGNQSAAFLGVVSDVPLASVLLDEGGSGDDIAVRDLRLGVPGGAPPAAHGYVVDASGLFARGAVYGFQLSGGSTHVAESRFDGGAGGWSVEGNGSTGIAHQTNGGDPGGFVSSFDGQGGVAFAFVAPSAFLGDRSDSIGGLLSWDWRALGDENDEGMNGAAALLLYSGGGITLSAALGQPTAQWSSEAVVLLRESFECTSGCAVTGRPPSAEEFETALSTLSKLSVRGDWVNGTGAQDTTALDDVRMTPPPSGPTPWAISSAGSLRDPSGVALEAAGTLVVADPNAAGGTGAVVRIDGASQTLLTSGGLLDTPLGIAIGASGELYVADANALGQAALIRVDPVSGAQSVVSSGGLLDTPVGIAVEPSGDLVVADRTAFGGTGGVVRVAPGSGAQSEVSSGGSFAGPTGIAVSAAGDLYVADPNALDRRGAVIHVDPNDGSQALAARAGWLVDPVAVAVAVDGSLLVVDQGAGSGVGGSGALIQVSPVTGEQTLLARGAPLRDPVALVVPGACANGLDDDGDGSADGADSGCAHAHDLAETNAALPCDDGLDNDDDGASDLADPGCRDALFAREDPQCQNGLHDDGDGRMDFDGGASIHGAALTAPDLQCSQPWGRERETCGLGFELALLLSALRLLRRRARARALLLGLGAGAALLAPGTLRAEPFTVVALPDTQKYVENDVFYASIDAQTQWIVDHAGALNVAFVTHLGDIVDDRNDVSLQWERALAALRRLDGVVPWGTAPGNHDLNSNKDGVSYLYDEFFAASNFVGRPGSRGVYHNNRSSFQVFSAGGLDFLILHLEYDPPDRVLDWAYGVLADHPQRRAIVSTHVFLNPDTGTRATAPFDRPDGNAPEEVWKKLIRPNCNVFLVLNGHYCTDGDGEAHLTDANLCGSLVHQAVTDFQCRPDGGDGWLRYYEFDPANDEIRARTYSPTRDEFETDSDSEFVLPYDLTP